MNAEDLAIAKDSVMSLLMIVRDLEKYATLTLQDRLRISEARQELAKIGKIIWKDETPC